MVQQRDTVALQHNDIEVLVHKGGQLIKKMESPDNSTIEYQYGEVDVGGDTPMLLEKSRKLRIKSEQLGTHKSIITLKNPVANEGLDESDFPD